MGLHFHVDKDLIKTLKYDSQQESLIWHGLQYKTVYILIL
jgi:hypothetical protein